MKFNIIKQGKYFLIFSILLFILSLILLAIFGLKLAIDFTGGTEFMYTPKNKVNNISVNSITNTYAKEYSPLTVTENANTYTITTKPLSKSETNTFESSLDKYFGVSQPDSINIIGATLSSQIKSDALQSGALVSLGIILFIAYAFRTMPKPISPIMFGLSAVLAMIHDVFIVLGVFSVLGVLFGVRIDSLFVTAILTVIGFSVHDTIVVFDRIRENLKKQLALSFEEVVNKSLYETLARSINTSLTVLLTLLSLYLLGGSSIREFTLALLVGIFSGTYSSIFVASQIIIIYQRIADRRRYR